MPHVFIKEAGDLSGFHTLIQRTGIDILKIRESTWHEAAKRHSRSQLQTQTGRCFQDYLEATTGSM
jgi:hypothetical protein